MTSSFRPKYQRENFKDFSPARFCSLGMSAVTHLRAESVECTLKFKNKYQMSKHFTDSDIKEIFSKNFLRFVMTLSKDK